MRSTTTTSNDTTMTKPRFDRMMNRTARPRRMFANWLGLGLSGQQWTASLLIGLLLLPVFSLPVGAAVTVRPDDAAQRAGFEPINTAHAFWEPAWTKLSVALEEWETAKRTANLTPPEVKIKSPDDINAKKVVQKIDIEIAGDGKMRRGETLTLGAVARGAENQPVPDIPVHWTSSDPAIIRIADDNQAVALEVGQATLIAGAAGITAETVLEVRDSEQPDAAVWNPKKSEASPKSVAPPSPMRNQPANRPILDEGEVPTLTSPRGNLGSPLGQTEPSAPNEAAALRPRERAGIGNFGFGVPVAALPGRGLNASIDLSYNSQLWNKSCAQYSSNGTDCVQNHFVYNVDGNWLAPGFQIGMGYLDAYDGELLLTDADGTRHQLDLVSNNYNYYSYESSDGEFVKAGYQYCPTCPNPMTSLGLTLADGTGIEYTNPNTQGRAFPKKIRDVQGNYMTISYLPNDEVGKISSIIDTLGREINFVYDSTSEQKLIAVTVPGYNNSSTPRQTIRFYYETIQLQSQSRFTGQITAPEYITVLKYLYFPGTKTGIRYDYSPYYGMIYKITQLNGVQLSGNDLAVVPNSYVESSSTRYNYPGTDIEPPSPTMNEVPKYNKRIDDWIGRDQTVAAPQTLYSTSENLVNGVGTTTTQITSPDGTTTVSVSNVKPGQWDDGLLTETSTITAGRTLPWSKTIMTWDDGPITRGRRNPRVIKKEQTNEIGQSRATLLLDYDQYNNPQTVKELDFAPSGQEGAELRRTVTTYLTSGQSNPYIYNQLLHLPTSIKTKVGTTTVARVDYEYDGASLTTYGPGSIGHHEQSYNPDAPAGQYCHMDCPSECQDPVFPNQVCSCPLVETCDPIPVYEPATAARGNITKIKAFADPTDDNDPLATVTTMKYDIAGNVVEASLNCCNLKTWEYTDVNKFAYPITETKGSDVQLTTRAEYDFNTGLVMKTINENDQPTTYEYEPNSLRQKKTVYPNGAFVLTQYSDQLVFNTQYLVPGFVLTTATLEANKSVQSYEYFDGRGAVLRISTLTPDGWSVAAIEYDLLGRPKKTYNPFYVGNANADIPAGTKYTEITSYDGLGRAVEVKLQDDTVIRTYPNEATAAYSEPDGQARTGTVTRVVDQADKERRQIVDALGRIVRVDEPDVTTGGLGTITAPTQPTHYYYDGNDNLTKVLQIEGSVRQERRFKYDGLSHLTHEKQVEATATLNDAGMKQQTGGAWTKVLKYTPKGLLASSTDARGVETTFAYDGLNRIKRVGYADGTPSVTYFYDQARSGSYNKGALTRIETVNQPSTPLNTLATATEFDYDLMGQIKQQRQSIGAQVYNLAYSYNLAGQLVSETYPSGRIVTTGYDANGRMQSVGDGGRTYLSAVGYVGKGNKVNSLVLGNGTGQGFAYNDRLQMQSQSLVKSNEVLQQYDYSYGELNTANVLKNNGKLAQVESYLAGGSKQWTQKFAYDADGRLKESSEYRGDTNALSYKQTFDYDRFGNLYREAANNQTTGQQSPLPYTTIEAVDIDQTTNRFKPAVGVGYDDSGNVTTDNKFRAMNFGYDANGRMVRATKANTPEATSVYDAGGQRVAECINNVWKFFVYDIGGKMVAEYGGAPSADEGGVKYPYTDWQGSTRALTSNSGFVQSRQDFTAFGEEISAGVGRRTVAQGFGATNNLSQKYAQTERDQATGLDNTWFRKLENRAGRWTSPDPYNGSMSLGNPQSFNRFSYVENQPTNFVDPSGLNLAGPNTRYGGFYDPMGVTYYVDGIISSAYDAWGLIGSGAGYIESFSVAGLTVFNTGHYENDTFIFTQTVHFFANNFVLGDDPDPNEIKRITDSCLQNIANVKKDIYDAIINNKKDAQSKSLSLAHAAVESSFDPKARGFNGEIGLFQLKPSTANSLGMGSFTASQLENPSINTQLGTTYLQNLINSFDGNVRTALGAYKQGARSVRENGLSKASQEYADGILGCEKVFL